MVKVWNIKYYKEFQLLQAIFQPEAKVIKEEIPNGEIIKAFIEEELVGEYNTVIKKGFIKKWKQ